MWNSTQSSVVHYLLPHKYKLCHPHRHSAKTAAEFQTLKVNFYKRKPCKMCHRCETMQKVFSLKKNVVNQLCISFIIKDMLAFPDLNNFNLPFSVAFFKTFMAYSWPASGPVTFLTRNTYAKKSVSTFNKSHSCTSIYIWDVWLCSQVTNYDCHGINCFSVCVWAGG